ncbi:MAG: hypothetical protein LBD42_06215 [Desulfovibrio sp.]|jgi:hypothetical protein|nr:hypothetical protein [Desulfovibrio sp.]
MPKSFDAPAVTAAKIKGDIVTKTLDTLNDDLHSGSGKRSGVNKMSDTYHLSKSVLATAYQGKGAVLSAKG